MSFRHLLTTLQALPGGADIPPNELDELLTDVQIGRNTARLQEEFHDSMEKVVNELKSHTIEVEPFLKPVTKKAAVDYDSIIRSPMDLGTVSKNVKSKAYRSKKKFAHDLNLIWENALKYNSVEGHPIRAQALYCRRLTLHLLDIVPERADGFEAFSRSGLTLTAAGPTPQVDGRMPRATLSAQEAANGQGALDARDGSGERMTRPGYHPIKHTLGDMPAVVRTPTTMQPLSILLQPSPISPVQKKQPGLRDRQRTAAPSWFPMGLAPAVNREPSKMESAYEEDGDIAWWAACDEIGALGQVVPAATAGSAVNPPIKHKRKRARLRHTPTFSLPAIIHGNIATLATVRKRFVRLSNRLTDPDAEEDGYSSDASDGSNADKPSAKRARRDFEGVAPVVDAGTAFAGLRRTTGAMLAHTGFENVSASALDLCSQLLETSVSNLGKSVIALRDRNGSSADISSSLQHALLANGMTQIVDLDQYLREDLVRYGSRLEEAAKKLKQAFKEIDVDVEEQDIEDSEFIFGGLSGMDDMSEFLGMEMPTIPKRLLAGKNRAAHLAAADDSKARVVDPYEAPPPFAPFLASDVPRQIGLIQDFFRLKLEEQGHILVDEEFDNSVPALGAFGQIVQRSAASVKKKAAGAVSAPAGAAEALVRTDQARRRDWQRSKNIKPRRQR